MYFLSKFQLILSCFFTIFQKSTAELALLVKIAVFTLKFFKWDTLYCRLQKKNLDSFSKETISSSLSTPVFFDHDFTLLLVAAVGSF